MTATPGRVFYGPNAPNGPANGDAWRNQTTNELRIWAGGQWTAPADDFTAPVVITGITNPQLQVGYDASNYMTIGVGSTGATTLNAVGSGSAFAFSDAVTITGGLTVATGGATITTGGLTVSAGGVGVGGSPTSGVAIDMAATFPDATSQQFIYRAQPTFNVSATSQTIGFITNMTGAAASHTTGTVAGFYARRFVVGAAQIVTNRYGLLTEADAGLATNAYGVRINAITSAGTANYGVFIEAPSGAGTNHGLHNAGTSNLLGLVTLTAGATLVTTAALTFGEGGNIVAGTGTGTKIGTATSQKLAFWNKTPIVQPTTGISAAAFVANTSGIANDTATFGGYTIGQMAAALINTGILA